MENQELYIRTQKDVFKVLAKGTTYNSIANRFEHYYEIMPNVWINDYEAEFEIDTKFEVDTNIHNLIDYCIYERKYNGQLERWISPHNISEYDANFETYVVDPEVSVYGAIWVRNNKDMPMLKPVCKFIGFNDIEMRH